MGHDPNELPEDGDVCPNPGCGKSWKYHSDGGMSGGKFTPRCGHDFDTLGVDPNMATIARLIALKPRVVELEKELLDKEAGFKMRHEIFETSLRDDHQKAVALKDAKIAELEKGILDAVSSDRQSQDELAALKRKLKDVEKERDLAVSSNKLMQQDVTALRAQLEAANNSKAKAVEEATRANEVRDAVKRELEIAKARTTQPVLPVQVVDEEDGKVGETTDVEGVDDLDDQEVDDLRVRSLPVMAHPPQPKCTADCDKHAAVSAQFVLKDGTTQSVAYCDGHLADGGYLADMVEFLKDEAVEAPESVDGFVTMLNASRITITPSKEIDHGRQHDGL